MEECFVKEIVSFCINFSITRYGNVQDPVATPTMEIYVTVNKSVNYCVVQKEKSMEGTSHV